MKIVAWNVRGAGKESCAMTIKDLKKAYAIDVFAILEPRISVPRALIIAQNLGFSHHHIIDATGFSGGGGSVTSRNKRWLLTVVYANPCPMIREALWKYFDGLVSSLPWLVLGDFNDIASADEKCGGNLNHGGKSFVDWIDHNHLLIWASLALNSLGVIKEMLRAHLMHLPRVNADHCPILVSLESNHSLDKGNVPFRFQAMWMSHLEFSTFIADCWNSGKEDYWPDLLVFNESSVKGITLISISWRGVDYRQTRLEEADLADLSSLVSVEEIKTNVFAIGGLKTPGLDGFPAIFYQKYWEMCSIDIITFVQECFNSATLPVHLNETLIALVPKVERPASMTQIRPISLCNTLYKVVSKILVARL
ncbi:unnamed protein product [Prunus armeniaca]